MRIGILGAGNISDTHARAASAIAGTTIVAVHGGNAARAERLAATYGATAYADLDAFLAHEPMDVVAIGSPSGLHAAQGIAACRRGLHVLVEKPIDVTVERADALIEAADAARASGSACSSRITCNPTWFACTMPCTAGGLGAPCWPRRG